MMLSRTAHSNGVQDSVKVTLVLTMLLVLVPLSSGYINLDVTAPEFVYENEQLDVSFTVDTNETNLTQYILKDGAVVGSGSYSWLTTNTDAGTYIFTFVANNSLVEEDEIKVIEVLESTADLDIISPPSGVITNDEVRISIQTEMEATSCSYSIDGSPGSLNEGTGEWFKIILLSQDKVYNLSASCTDGVDTIGSSIIFILDTTPPAITSKKPQGSYAGNPITLELNTNENSFCKYSLQNILYNSMENSFDESGGTYHKQLVHAKSQGDITYYVACEDKHGNKMPGNEEINFFANLKPTASVAISGNNRKADLLRPGTYDIKLTTSEPVIGPSLEYEFANEGTSKSLSLEGQGNQWTGFLTIQENQEDDVGTFKFSAKDLTDLQGTEITGGKIFLVDTIKPDPIESLQLSTLGINVELKWFYDGEAVDNYNIYRDTEPGVDYLDKWDEAPAIEEYTDITVLLGKRYYYRVAAVDKAGNIGPLSDEKSILVDAEAIQEDINPEVNRKLNSTQKILEGYVFDVDLALRSLTAETDLTKLQVIGHLNLVDKATQAKSNIETLISEIDKLKLIGLNDEEASKRIEVFLESSGNHQAQVAKEIVIVDSTRQDLTILEEDIDEIISEVLVGLKLDPESKQNYMANMRRLQDNVRVTMQATSAKIYTIGSVSPLEVTLVEKNIIADETIEEAIIVENVDKGVARRDNEIIFKDPPTVLRPDPIVKWEQKDLTSRDIVYHVEKLADLADVKNSVTAVLEKPRKEQVTNEITGAIIEETETEGSILSQIIFLLGIIILAGLFIYYIAYVKEEKAHPKHVIVKNVRAPNAPIYSTLREAHMHVDGVNYEEALRLYKLILQSNKKTRNKQVKAKVDKGTKQLYEKLILLNSIKQCHHAVDTKDVDKLKSNMLEIKDRYHRLGKETELSQHIRKNYSYFIKHMRNMDREDFFNNLEL